MRVLLPLLFLPLPAPPPSTSPIEAIPAAPLSAGEVHWAPCGIFDPHLEGCWGLRWTRRSLCALGAQESYWIEWSEDVSNACGAQLSFDEPDSVLIDATSWDKHFAELRIAHGGTLYVDAELGNGWRPQPLPKEFQPAGRAARPDRLRGLPVIAGRGETLVVFAYQSIFRLEHQVWSRVPLDLGGREPVGHVTSALLEGRKLYLGVEGIPTGQLIAADIDTGRTTVASDAFPAGPTNVTDLELGPDGKLYVTCAEPLFAFGGRLLVHDGDSWTVLVDSPTAHRQSICIFDRTTDAPVDPNSAGVYVLPGIDSGAHFFPSANFLALAFDDQRRPCILCSGLGILRRELDGSWKCVTPGWAESGAEASDLTIVGHTAVLASRNAGVVLLDLETLEGRRVQPK